MVLTLCDALPIKNGMLLVTDGQEYAMLDQLTQGMVDSFNAATKGIDTKHLLVTQDPKLCQLLGVVAVPTIFLISEGTVVAELVGIVNEQQIRAFLETGVSPC